MHCNSKGLTKADGALKRESAVCVDYYKNCCSRSQSTAPCLNSIVVLPCTDASNSCTNTRSGVSTFYGCEEETAAALTMAPYQTRHALSPSASHLGRHRCLRSRTGEAYVL
jgi:hypothetical protein